MFSYKFLQKEDLENFSNFVEKLEDKKTQEIHAWKFFINSIKNDRPEIIVSVEIKDTEIISAVGCYSFPGIWGRPSKVVPFWVAGITRSIDSYTSVGKRIDQIMTPACTHFENLGYNSFYTSRLLPSRIDYTNCENYLKRYGHRINSVRYDSRIELLESNVSAYNNLSNFYKVFAHNSWPSHKKLAILRYDLKYSERNNDI